MDLMSHLPPPSFYLSTPKDGGRFWLFTDAPVFPERYGSDLNVVPLPGMNAPYVSQGAGRGWVWAFEAKLNPFHKFLADAGDAGTSARDPSPNSVYADYLEIKRFIAEYGPSPLLLLHRPGEEQVVVALQDFTSEIALSQDTMDYDGQLPSVIPVTMTLVEVPEYRVRFS
jgi:hypothetical protein